MVVGNWHSILPMRPAAIAIALLVAGWRAGAQAPGHCQSLTQLIETERAFAARALVIGWKDAFLDHFSPSAVGFAEGKPGAARSRSPS